VLETPERSGNFRGNYTRRPSRSCESPWMKIIGKPYSGKPKVRFDEGELEIELLATTSALYSTKSLKMVFGVGGILKSENFFLVIEF
jgi:hypothetical protein